ncbi:Group 3 secretory phospholipase [Trichinella spiralis]|uniref:Group 3 secretory phospholipase n=1 Tax=Trichinella spiralis TaxID=6334 RepID=A0ABR3KSJ9_TRISP
MCWTVLLLTLAVRAVPSSPTVPPQVEVPELGSLTDKENRSSFVLVERLSNDERQLFAQNGTRWARILTLSNSTKPGVTLVVSADIGLVVKSILSTDSQLLDCDILDDEHEQQLLDQFQADIGRVLSESHFEFHWLNETDYSAGISLLQAMDVYQQKQNCLELHASHNRTRAKRAFVSSGTKWCGIGTTAISRNDLGYYAGVDACCLHHDQCAFTINPQSTKYGLKNNRFYTISLCDCDDQFYECLKNETDSFAWYMGKLFFSLMATPCFTLRIGEICTEYSWWGACRNSILSLKADMRNAVPF